MDYIAIIEQGPRSWGAYVPDLPGCIAAGESREEAVELIREAIHLHLASMRQDGQEAPPPSCTIEVVHIDV